MPATFVTKFSRSGFMFHERDGDLTPALLYLDVRYDESRNEHVEIKSSIWIDDYYNLIDKLLTLQCMGQEGRDIGQTLSRFR